MENSPPYKVAVITGASRGLGEGLALALAKRGVTLALMARDKTALDGLVKKVADAGGKAIAISCDVSSRADVLQAFAKAKEALGFIDLLIANAGVSVYNPVHKWDGAKAEQVYKVNVLGLMYSIEGVLADMVKARKGHIVGISSLASFVSMPTHTVYCASKAAVSSQLSGLRAELAGLGVSVTTICPGYVRTEMTAKNRFRMPFLMDVDKATKLMMNAIIKRKREYAYPWPMALLTRTLRFVPLFIKERVLSMFVSRSR